MKFIDEELDLIHMLCRFWIDNIQQEETDKNEFLEVVALQEKVSDGDIE